MSADLINEEFRIGPYVLKRLLGEGGNGQVYLAWKDNATGVPIACVAKLPLQRYATSEEVRFRSFKEARLVMQVSTDAHIVRVTDVLEFEGMPVIVMEYIDGANLQFLLGEVMQQRDGLSLPSVYNILASVAAALHHAHVVATIDGKAVKVVHRDIKPDNILVTKGGAIKLTDFGIGGTMHEGPGQYMRGTPRYMSLEHLRCEIRPEMDIYSLGVVAWEMIENREYRGDMSGHQHYPAIMDGDIPPMIAGGTPAQLVELVQACLHPSANHRPTASELLSALARCPGYTRDPEPVAQEIAAILGTRRNSGVSQQHLAASPELVATFAVLKRQRGDSDRKPAHGGVNKSNWPRGEDGRTSTLTEPLFVEQDAPRLLGRGASPRLPKLSKTLDLGLDVGAVTPERGQPSGRTPPIEAPKADKEPAKKREPAVTSAAVVRETTERVPPPDGSRQTLEPGPHLRGGADGKQSGRADGKQSGRARWILALACIGAPTVLAILVAYWLGTSDDDPQLDERPTVTAAQEPVVTATAPLVPERPRLSEPLPQPVEDQPSALAQEPSSPETAPEETLVALPEEPPAAVPAASKTKTRTARRKPVAQIPITLVLFLVDAAELKIGRKKVLLRSRKKIEIPAGTHRVKWRLVGEKDWRDAGRKRFNHKGGYLVRVHRAKDPEILELEGSAG